VNAAETITPETLCNVHNADRRVLLINPTDSASIVVEATGRGVGPDRNGRLRHAVSSVQQPDRYPTRSRRLSVRNCPQAARISCPRGVRIGAANPAALTIPANRSSAAFPLAS
jgi:hypothetical protein